MTQTETHFVTTHKSFHTAQLDDQIGFQLRLAQLAVFSDIIDGLKIHELRPVDLSVLLIIEAHPGLRQHVIGDQLQIARPNLVPIVDSLQRRELIERVVDSKDRRANQLRLTARGSDLLTEAKHVQDAHRDRLLTALDGVDIANFMRGLSQLAKMAPQKNETAKNDS